MHRTLRIPSLVFLLGLSLVGCDGDNGARGPASAPARGVTAEVSRVEPVAVPALSAAAGTVVAVESVKVASRLMGYIRDIAVAEGQVVRAGQRLFTIDPLDIEGAVDQARLGLQQAEDAMRDAEADFRRFEALHKEDVVSRQQYEKMKLNYDVAVSRAAQARAALATARGQMRYATVTSPIDGVVTQKFANEGDIAAPGHPVLVVENPTRLQVQTAVGDAVYRSLRLGMDIRVEVDGLAAALTAKVGRLSPAADPMTHTYTVKLDVTAPGLRSGAFARALFPVGTRTILPVPRAAVQNRAGISGVFVIDAEGIARFRMVRVGDEQGGLVEILSGLNPGERVVTGNADAVNTGDRVQG